MTAKNPTHKQRRFVKYFVASLNAKESAIKAGYSKDTTKQIGHNLLTKVDHVKAAVEDGLSKHNSKVEITRDLVLEGLHREATGAEGDSSASSRVSAWSNLGKFIGMDATRELQHDINFRWLGDDDEDPAEIGTKPDDE